MARIRRSSLERALQKVEDTFPVTFAPELGPTVHWTPSENLPVHRWFRYREGFSPYLLEHFGEAQHRLDPFCGCGTTLLESAMRGTHSYGIDLNPLATFITRTKTRHYNSSDRLGFMRAGDEIERHYRLCSPAPKPAYPLITKLYLPESLEILLRIKNCISSIESLKIRNLLFLVWLSILEQSSNVFKEGNGLKYRNKRRKPGKYITVPDSEWIPRYFGKSVASFVECLWRQKCAQVAEDMAAFKIPSGFTPKVRTGSCLKPENLDFQKPIDLAIFSPPYANRFDYFEAFKIELWMGGFVSSSYDMANLRSESMHNNLAARKFDSDIKWPELAPFLDCMDERASSVRMGIKDTLEGYFHDTRTLLRILKSVLADRARVVIVVGNSAYARSIIPTDLLIARIGKEEGYRICAVKVARRLHVSSQQRCSLDHLERFMRESIVILEKR